MVYIDHYTTYTVISQAVFIMDISRENWWLEVGRWNFLLTWFFYRGLVHFRGVIWLCFYVWSRWCFTRIIEQDIIGQKWGGSNNTMYGNFEIFSWNKIMTHCGKFYALFGLFVFLQPKNWSFWMHFPRWGAWRFGSTGSSSDHPCT